MRALRVMAVVVALLAPSLAAALGPAVEQAVLANGATLLVSEQRNLPLVMVRVVLDAGARWDPPGRAGAASLTADLLAEGTAKRSAAQISEAIDFIGGSLNADASMDYAQLQLQVLRKDLDVGLDLLADILLRPAFSADELARRREAALASIRAGRDNPTEVATRAFRPALYGEEPYGHPVEGTEESVPRITRQDIQGFYAARYRPTGAIVVVVGDLSMAEARARLDTALRDWRGAPVAAFAHATAPAPAAQTVRLDRPISQAGIILGHRGVPRDNPDFETISVMNYILGGGGFSSRLLDNIRTKAGLAYSVASFFTTNKLPGSFQIIMQTKNASVADAIARARAEVERIRSEPVGDDELSDAKRYLTGSFPLRLDSNSDILEFVAQTAFFGLGPDYAERYLRRINAVTKEDVQRVAQQYLHPEAMIEVVVGDLGQMSPAAP